MWKPSSVVQVVRYDGLPAEHFCSTKCKEAAKPCDLCLAQRRKIEEDQLRAESKPTLKYNPFAALGKPKG